MRVVGDYLAFGCLFIGGLCVFVYWACSSMLEEDCQKACDPLNSVLLSERNGNCYCEGEEGILFPAEKP